MPVTYRKIATITVTTATQAAIEFTSIPATYTDLVVKCSCRTNKATSLFENIYIQFNNDTGTKYRSRLVYNVNNAAGSEGDSTDIPYLQFMMYGTTVNNTANTFANTELYIPNYISTNNKSVSGDFTTENNATDVGILAFASGIWFPTTNVAITSIKLTPSNSSFVQHSTATLYGIKKD